MVNLSPHERELILDEVRKQPYATRFATSEIEFAIASAVNLFSAFERKILPGFCGVLLHPRRSQRAVDFARQLIPAFVYAHRFFGSQLPSCLEQKLTNEPQTHDTLFELTCLGAFQPHHTVRYEPALVDGRVPDLMLTLSDGREVYVECKSQGLLDSESHRLFEKFGNRLHDALSLDSSSFVAKAWADGLRTEVRVSHTPSEADLRLLEQTIDQHSPVECQTLQFGRTIKLSLVARHQPFDQSKSTPSAVFRVGTTPTSVDHVNAHSAVYPWPGLDIIRRRSQRRLLSSARRKLRALPANALGLICMQTLSTRSFVPDVHRLLQQTEYERIPLVWLNPNGMGQLIFRNDARELRDAVFGPLIAKRASETR